MVQAHAFLFKKCHVLTYWLHILMNSIICCFHMTCSCPNCLGCRFMFFFFLLKMSYFLCFVKLMANLPNLIYMFLYDRHMSHWVYFFGVQDYSFHMYGQVGGKFVWVCITSFVRFWMTCLRLRLWMQVQLLPHSMKVPVSSQVYRFSPLVRGVPQGALVPPAVQSHAG